MYMTAIIGLTNIKRCILLTLTVHISSLCLSVSFSFKKEGFNHKKKVLVLMGVMNDALIIIHSIHSILTLEKETMIILGCDIFRVGV